MGQMIAQLTGTVNLLQPDKRSLILVVHDVGYKVFVPTTLCEQWQVGQTVTVFTHHYVREDLMALYGFVSLADLELFERLISVNGIGPKAALALLSQLSSQELRNAIIQGDLLTLTRTPGIGKKIAERLVMELKQPLLEAGEAISLSDQSGAQDIVDALQNFGYSQHEIRSVLQHIDRTQAVGMQIKAALGYLSQHGRTR